MKRGYSDKEHERSSDIICDYVLGNALGDICSKYQINHKVIYRLLSIHNVPRNSSIKKTSYIVYDDLTEFHIKHKGAVYTIIIDTDDLAKVLDYSKIWCLYQGKQDKYTLHSGPPTMYMHRLIMDAKQGEEIDHINHSTLDNRKCNLRVCSHAENVQNRNGSDRGSRTQVRGVYIDGREYLTNRYIARVTVNKYTHNLGYFHTISEAETAVKEARRQFMPFSQEALPVYVN